MSSNAQIDGTTTQLDPTRLQPNSDNFALPSSMEMSSQCINHPTLFSDSMPNFQHQLQPKTFRLDLPIQRSQTSSESDEEDAAAVQQPSFLVSAAFGSREKLNKCIFEHAEKAKASLTEDSIDYDPERKLAPKRHLVQNRSGSAQYGR